MSREIRILIADDHPIVREGFTRVIARDPALKVVAEADEGGAAIERLTALGIVLGLVAASWLTRWLSSLLFDVTPLDPATFVAVSLLLLTVALTACWIPARRAARIDPIQALREP